MAVVNRKRWIPLRNYLLRRLAAGDPVVINATIYGSLHIPGNCAAFVYGSSFNPKADSPTQHPRMYENTPPGTPEQGIVCFDNYVVSDPSGSRWIEISYGEPKAKP